MKRIFTFQFIIALLSIAVTVAAQDSLFISEVTDPADDYSGRFIELYNAGNEEVDLDQYIFYISRQSNGGTSWGDLQLTGSVPGKMTYVIGGSGFESIYGFAPDIVTGILTGNGNDAYCLFRDGDHSAGTLQDIFGAMDTDGTGELWEYVDSRALRVESVLAPNTTWDPAEWEITAANVADCDPGTHNGSVPVEPVPPDGYAVSLINDTVTVGQTAEVLVSVSELTAADNIISYQFDLDFDTTVLEYESATVSGTEADGGTVIVNPVSEGRLSAGYMNTEAITGSGAILIVRFNTMVPDTTDLIISNVFLNTVSVEDLTNGKVIVSEEAPPTAIIQYSDTVNRFADTLIISAIFSEPMDAAEPVTFDLTGAVTLTGGVMSRINETEYRSLYQIPKADGEVFLRLSGGTDLWGNEVVPDPTAGGTFTILAFVPGDVSDDGTIQAYDAALTLQHSVGIDPLPEVDPVPWEPWRDSTANVDGVDGITANDASLILQYSVGIISEFTSGAMDIPATAHVSAEVVDHQLVFYSHGDLLGLNITATDENRVLGLPEILNKEFLSAINIDESDYRIGLCTSYPARDGDPLLRIPINGNGKVQFNLIVNTQESELTIDLATGLHESDNESFEIYPNPVYDKLKLSGLTDPGMIRIFNIHGQLLFTESVQELNSEVDLSALPEGVYMIFLDMKGESAVRKFLKR